MIDLQLLTCRMYATGHDRIAADLVETVLDLAEEADRTALAITADEACAPAVGAALLVVMVLDWVLTVEAKDGIDEGTALLRHVVDLCAVDAVRLAQRTG